MNKYSDKSDFEINKAVAVIINGTDAVVEKFGRLYIVDEDGCAMVSFDPCNNPADAMPIIIENGISMINDSGKLFAAAPGVGVDGYLGDEVCGFGSYRYSENDNIYRAAMEVFLMMKDAEK